MTVRDDHLDNRSDAHAGVSVTQRAQVKVLLVDTLSSGNDFGVELPLALDSHVDLTFFTIHGTRLKANQLRRMIVAFPEFWGSRGKLSKLVDQLKAVVQLRRELWAHRHSAVHVQFFRSIALELPLYLLMRPFLRRLVCTVHNALPHETRRWHRAVYGYWYRRLDRLHVLSRHTGEQLVSEFGVSRDRIVFAPHGNYANFRRDHPSAERARVRKDLSVSEEACLVLYFGLIRPYKGVDRLIEAAAQLQSSHVRLLAAGGCTPEIEHALRQRMKSLGLQEQRMVLQVGHLSEQRMSDLIGAADVVVFPYHHIYQSGALLLAMTFGKAIIASDLAGFREYVQPGRTGLLCDTANPVAFARTMDTLANNSDLRMQLAEAAGVEAATTYSWQRVADTLSEAYAK